MKTKNFCSQNTTLSAISADALSDFLRALLCLLWRFLRNKKRPYVLQDLAKSACHQAGVWLAPSNRKDTAQQRVTYLNYYKWPLWPKWPTSSGPQKQHITLWIFSIWSSGPSGPLKKQIWNTISMLSVLQKNIWGYQKKWKKQSNVFGIPNGMPSVWQQNTI